MVQSDNIAKSANMLVIRWQDLTATDMASFVHDLKGLIDKERRDVQRTLLGLSSPYILRLEYQNSIKCNANFFEKEPGNCDLATSNLKVVIYPVNLRKGTATCLACTQNSARKKCHQLTRSL